ncbi:hypothetical protein [Aquabacterium sp.]|uniref:hypothetical protein n=1 Tax=Aquabacterium sp. TaxID=1872578 RepID=UPI002BC0177C|nr:hypothetical protein [Aquabacterium sp.]HSW06595.1 hypothetical protein [Aquabacterium sp.]
MQRVQTSLSQGVDGWVKTIYSPPPLLIEHNFFSGGFIVKSADVVTSNRPVHGVVVFVRAAAAMKSFGGYASALHLSLPAGCQLDRDEDQMHPGEGSA